MGVGGARGREVTRSLPLPLCSGVSAPKSRDRELTDLLGSASVSTFPEEVGSASRRLTLDTLRAPPLSSAQQSRGAPAAWWAGGESGLEPTARGPREVGRGEAPAVPQTLEDPLGVERRCARRAATRSSSRPYWNARGKTEARSGALVRLYGSRLRKPSSVLPSSPTHSRPPQVLSREPLSAPQLLWRTWALGPA